MFDINTSITRFIYRFDKRSQVSGSGTYKQSAYEEH